MLIDNDSTNSVSEIAYEISGITGNRVLKIQWKNAGFRDWCTSTNNPNDSVNFQMWLFESDSHFEVHFGSNYSNLASYGNPSCNTGSTGPQVRLKFSGCGNTMSLNGSANAPSATIRNHCFWMPSVQLSGTPSDGTIYSFTPNGTPVGIEEVKLDVLSIYPNPASNNIQIKTEQKVLNAEIYSSSGKKVLSTTGKDISIKGLAKGMYYMRVQTSEGFSFDVFVKE